METEPKKDDLTNSGWTRTTVVVREEHMEKLKILAWWENATLKDLFADMIEHYLASKPHLDRFFEERKNNLKKKQSASKEP